MKMTITDVLGRLRVFMDFLFGAQRRKRAVLAGKREWQRVRNIEAAMMEGPQDFACTRGYAPSVQIL